MADAANRVLGSVINKYQNNYGFGYYTYTKSFLSTVGPIPDYASEVWGYKNFTQIDAVQNKAIRILMGLHKFGPIAAINGDMDWTSSCVRHKINIIRFWSRLMCVNNNHLLKLIFNWDYSFRGKYGLATLRVFLMILIAKTSLFLNHRFP